MYCPRCGATLPDDAAFCMKCGYQTSSASSGVAQDAQNPQPAVAQKPDQVIAPQGVTSFKCPNCGAPLSPKFGEMVITCEYCGSAVALQNSGWTNIQKQSLLPVKIATIEDLNKIVNPMMDHGLLHRHLQEDSTQEEMSLSYVPYWIVNVSARTTVVAADETQMLAQTAANAALWGIVFGGGGFGGGGGGGRGGGVPGRRRIFGDGIFGNSSLSGYFGFRPIMAWPMGMGYGGGGNRKTEQMDANYNFPVVALKALTAYQPREYQFDMEQRQLFDITKVSKEIKVLNGDIGEEDAKAQAKTLVDQLQSQKAHAKYHMIQQLNSQIDVGEVELLHAPIWFVKYDHKGNKIVLVVDANSGRVINSIGL